MLLAMKLMDYQWKGAVFFLISCLICPTNAYQDRFISWMSQYKRFFSRKSTIQQSPTKDIGLLVTQGSDYKSWRNLRSQDSFEECEIEIINNSNKSLVFCWVSFEGDLTHYYPIDNGEIKDGSASNSHIEYTRVNHCFVCYSRIEETPFPRYLQDIPLDHLVFVFVPQIARKRHCINISSSLQGKYNFQCYCRDICRSVVSSTNKEYLLRNIRGFTVRMESSYDNEEVQCCLDQDLASICCLLPDSILTRIKKDISIYVNQELWYGPQDHPILGLHCVYHPLGGQCWLSKNGMNIMKAGNIEIYNGSKYLTARKMWGEGGLLLHEFNHAIHDHYMDQGYDNSSILQLYDQAMSKNLYKDICHHGSSEKSKGYCCVNAMEFFAELSTAFHWNVDSCTEFNKWFPFNRYQIKEYDSRTCQGLEWIWNDIEEKLKKTS